MDQPVYISGRWQRSAASGTFRTTHPLTRRERPEEFPVSSWTDCDAALAAAAEAATELRRAPGGRIAAFLDGYARELETCGEAIVAAAHDETGYPVAPRLRDVELPRTTNQLRQAACAARDESWRMPVIDSAANIRSCLAAVGPVCVFGPNNFPLAFGAVSGGDFAAAVAAGNPVICKAHPLHPRTATLCAEAAERALADAQLPPATVQLIYQLAPDDGCRLVSDARLAATAFTGSRAAGLGLKRAADHAGRLIYLELSSINPVVVLPGALKERSAEIADEFCTSALMAAGQFCTNPGLLVLMAGAAAEEFIDGVARQFHERPAGPLLSSATLDSLAASLDALREGGAEEVAGRGPVDSDAAWVHANTLLRVAGKHFLSDPVRFQTEAFGNASLAVVVDGIEEAVQVVGSLEGNLTGAIYSAFDGSDDAHYARLEPPLRVRVGRLLNDKMPTGVAVSPAMHHGGPYPSTGHPHFTAVGIPAALRRFGMLQCYDNVREERLPDALRDKNPNGSLWRNIDGSWTQADVARAGNAPAS